MGQKHEFRTSAGIISAMIVATRQEALRHCYEHAEPAACWEKALQCFRIFKPIAEVIDNVQSLRDYSGSLNLPARNKFQVMRRILGQP